MLDGFKVKVIADSISPTFDRVVSLELRYPRFIHQELLTHRVLSRNSSSCLSGDTEVTINKPAKIKKGIKNSSHMKMTIKEIVDKWFDGDSLGRDMKGRLKSMNLRCLNEDTGEFENTHIVECFRQGVQDVFEVELDKGYKIKCTENHRIYTESGWTTLKDMGLRLGNNNQVSWNVDSPKIATNGFEITAEFLIQQRALGKTLKAVADELNISYKALTYYTEKHKITFKRTIITPDETFEYKDKEWLLQKKKEGLTCGRIAELCHSTEDRVKKSARRLGVAGFIGTIRLGGGRRISWNKGKTYRQTKLDKTRAAAKLRIKPDSYKEYKNLNVAVTRFLQTIRADVLKMSNYRCAATDSKKELELHHLVPVWYDKSLAFDKSNIVVLTKKFHRFIHARNLDLEFMEWLKSGKSPEDFASAFEEVRKKAAEINKPVSKGNCLVVKYNKIKNIKYLGKEETYDIEVQGPYHNFIANGIVVHNSRARPVKSIIDEIESHPAMPVHWGKNKPGMQAHEELSQEDQQAAIEQWNLSAKEAIQRAKALVALGVHKQVANRILEPYQFITTIVTATEWLNFFELRCHADAQPEIQKLALMMQQAIRESVPSYVDIDEWHLPYIREQDKDLSLEDKIKVSVARCARVSYNTHDGKDTPLDKDLALHDRLIGSRPGHWSPAEHQCRPYLLGTSSFCRNFRGWQQYRDLAEKGIEIR